MAIDMCSENYSTLTTSPRISFSHDLPHSDNVPIEQSTASASNSEQFDFSLSGTIKNEPSSADELFSDGLILPQQLQQRFVTSKHISTSTPQVLSSPLPPLPHPSPHEISKRETTKDILSVESEKKHESRSFWGIKRSTSLHICDNVHKKSSFWSLPILPRSNSTGSVSTSKPTAKKNYSSSSSSFYVYPLSQKPPMKKNYGGHYGNNGVRISPVLNVPPPFISNRAANLFGLGSFFGNGKDKKSRK